MSDQTTSGLMDQIHQLKQQLTAARAARDAVARDYQAAARGEEAARQQLADAEKRGAVKALRYVADYWEARIGFGPIADTGLDDAKQQEVVAAAAQGLRESARRIESGEVTLP